MDPRDPIDNEPPRVGMLDRFRQSWFPPAAVVGAFAAFAGAAFRSRPTPRPVPVTSDPPGSSSTQKSSVEPAAPLALRYARTYVQTGVFGGGLSAHPFHRSLDGIAVGAGDRIWALADDEVQVFTGDGAFVRSWKVGAGAINLAVAQDGRVYLAALGRIDIYEPDGRIAGGFAVGAPAEPASGPFGGRRPATLTAIKLFGDEILVADAAARRIRRFDAHGRPLGDVGTQGRTRGFMLPNGSLDFDVDSSGVIRATDPGRHRVTTWALDGSPLGFFGKFGARNPEDFGGCCNPVNLAVTPDGKIVTAEKAVARVKVYEPDGTLLAVIGSDHFDPNCVHVHVAVDSRGRILTADPVRREVKLFSRSAGT